MAQGDSTTGKNSSLEAPMGAQLKSARLGKGWTQRDLAEALGVTASRVSRWEAGSTPIPSEQIETLYRILDLATVMEVGDPPTYRGRPRSNRSRVVSGPHSEPAKLHTRVELVELLSFLFQRSYDDCEFLLQLAIDDGPLTIRACLETSIVSLAMTAQKVVVEPKDPEQVYPVFLEHTGYATSHRPVLGDRSGSAPRQGRSAEQGPEALPLGIPVSIPETIMQFSYANNRLVVPAVSGPNHERAAFVLITNLVYQIRAAEAGSSS